MEKNEDTCDTRLAATTRRLKAVRILSQLLPVTCYLAYFRVTYHWLLQCYNDHSQSSSSTCNSGGANVTDWGSRGGEC